MSRRAKRHRAAVMLFSHTHRQLLLEKDELTFCNPGDMYRGSAGEPGGALLTVERPVLEAALLKRNEENVWTTVKKEQWTYSESTVI